MGGFVSMPLPQCPAGAKEEEEEGTSPSNRLLTPEPG